jgi:hypothetical protein
VREQNAHRQPLPQFPPTPRGSALSSVILMLLNIDLPLVSSAAVPLLRCHTMVAAELCSEGLAARRLFLYSCCRSGYPPPALRPSKRSRSIQLVSIRFSAS